VTSLAVEVICSFAVNYCALRTQQQLQ